jgi:hypothetical protein
MNDEIVVENFVDENGHWKIHVMSNTPIENSHPKWGEGTVIEEAGSYHFRTWKMYEGVIDIRLEGWKRPKRFVLRTLDKGQRMRDTIRGAAEEFMREVGELPGFAFVKYLPRGVENGAEVEIEGGEVLLFAAEWMMEMRVAVGWKEQ